LEREHASGAYGLASSRHPRLQAAPRRQRRRDDLQFESLHWALHSLRTTPRVCGVGQRQFSRYGSHPLSLSEMPSRISTTFRSSSNFTTPLPRANRSIPCLATATAPGCGNSSRLRPSAHNVAPSGHRHDWIHRENSPACSGGNPPRDAGKPGLAHGLVHELVWPEESSSQVARKPCHLQTAIRN